MCGMAGAYSTGVLNKFELENVRKLASLNHFRGTDSVGMMTYHKKYGDNKNVFSHYKAAMHPLYFTEAIFDKKYVDNKWSKDHPNLVGIHCRAATKGKVAKKNAHPFVFDHIIGMHNGTIHATQPNENKFETDSEALYYNISEMGLQEALNKTHGGQIALALVWLDAKKNTLNFYRNSLRPLHVYHAGSTIYWSSDSKDLDYVLPKASTEVKNGMGKPMREALSVNPEMLFEVDLSQTGEVVWKASPLKKEYATSTPKRDYRNPTQLPQLPKSTVGGSSSSGDNRVRLSEAYIRIPWDSLNEDGKAFKNALHFVCSEKAPYFAIEFDGFLSAPYMLALLLWRKFFFKSFVKLLSERYQKYADKSGFLRDMRRAGLSKNALKKIMKFQATDFVTKPHLANCLREDGMGVRVDPEFIPAMFAQWELERARNYANQSYKGTGNVLPFTPKEEEIDEELDDIVPVGVSGRYVTAKEAEKMLSNGCDWCGDPIDFSELDFVLWTSESKCLCISCMESIFAGAVAGAGVPYVEKIPELLEAREKNLEEVYKVETGVVN